MILRHAIVGYWKRIMETSCPPSLDGALASDIEQVHRNCAERVPAAFGRDRYTYPSCIKASCRTTEQYPTHAHWHTLSTWALIDVDLI